MIEIIAPLLGKVVIFGAALFLGITVVILIWDIYNNISNWVKETFLPFCDDITEFFNVSQDELIHKIKTNLEYWWDTWKDTLCITTIFGIPSLILAVIFYKLFMQLITFIK